jgi:hypothetical protein
MSNLRLVGRATTSQNPQRVKTLMPISLAALSAIATALLTSTAAADAQDFLPYIDGVGAYNAGQNQRRLLPGSNAPGTQQPQPSVGNHSTAEVLTERLTFKPSSSVSLQVNQAVADLLSGQNTIERYATMRSFESALNSNQAFRSLLAKQLGTSRSEILQTLNAGALQKKFNARLASARGSAFNMADVSHSFLIFSWGVVNDRAFNYSAVLNGMRQKIFALVSSQKSSLPPAGTDAEKQRDAEITAAMTELMIAAWRSGTQADRVTIQAGVTAWGKQLGIDYRAVNLTERGFVARR